MTQKQYEYKIAKLIITTSNKNIKSFSVEKIDSNYSDDGEYELRELVDGVLKNFENKNYISVKFKTKTSTLISKIYINQEKIQEVAKEYKLQTKSDINSKINDALTKYENSRYSEITTFVKEQKKFLSEGKRVLFVEDGDTSLLDDVLFGAESILSQKDDITLREFSISTYKDSKKTENLFSRIRKVLSRNENEKMNDILQEYHIYRNPVFTLIKGNGVIHFNNGEKITLKNDNGGLQLSMEYVKNISNIETNKMLTIENITSFTSHLVQQDDGIIMYLGGFSNDVNIEFLKKIECDIYHFGDIDANGFKILHNLEKRIGKTVNSYKMSIEEIDKYISTGKPIDEFNKTELSKMTNQDIYSYEEKNIFKYLLEKKITIEQEIVK